MLPTVRPFVPPRDETSEEQASRGASENTLWFGHYQVVDDGSDFGWSVACAEDVNNDGYDDVLVGARLHDVAGQQGGRVFVYHGSPTELGATPATTLDGNHPFGDFGHAVAGAGDIDGDGKNDAGRRAATGVYFARSRYAPDGEDPREQTRSFVMVR